MRQTSIWTGLGMLAVTGCATLPAPPALSAARAAYDQVRSEPAGHFDAAEVQQATQSLQAAEEEAKRDPASWQAGDSAYVAQRRLETVLVHGRQRQFDAHRAQIEQQLAAGTTVLTAPSAPSPAAPAGATVINNIPGQATPPRDDAQVAALSAQVQQLQRDAEMSRKATADAEQRRDAEARQQKDKLSEQRDAERTAALKAKEAELAQARKQLESERQARQQAEALAKVAKVHEEPRGLVVSLSGNVLFVSGKSTLLPSAQRTLSEIATALKGGEPRQITVEGHTDSRGSAETNARLSQSRAQAVLDYLAQQGVPSDRMNARGLGPAVPIADNRSSEGRAMNRRVELVLSKSAAPAVGGSGSTAQESPSAP